MGKQIYHNHISHIMEKMQIGSQYLFSLVFMHLILSQIFHLSLSLFDALYFFIFIYYSNIHFSWVWYVVKAIF